MKSKQKLSKSVWINALIIFIYLCVHVTILLTLYLWGVFASLKTSMQFSQSPIAFPGGWPWEWAWENYLEALLQIKVQVETPSYRGYVYVETMLLNSVLYSIGGAFIHIFTTWLVAYLCGRFDSFKFSTFLYTFNLVIMFVPVFGNTASSLAIYKFMGWYDNYLFIIVNNIAFTGTQFMILYAYNKGLGKSYYESAYMDGAGEWTILTRIAFPLTSPMFLVYFLMGAIDRWNNYTTMILWMPNHPTLAYGVYLASNSTEDAMSMPNLKIAVSIVLMVPVMALFISFQKYIMRNLKVGALKG